MTLFNSKLQLNLILNAYFERHVFIIKIDLFNSLCLWKITGYTHIKQNFTNCGHNTLVQLILFERRMIFFKKWYQDIAVLYFGALILLFDFLNLCYPTIRKLSFCFCAGTQTLFLRILSASLEKAKEHSFIAI